MSIKGKIIPMCASALLALVAAFACAGSIAYAPVAHADEGEIAITAAIFPDEAFFNYVSENFDSDGDGALSKDEIAAVTEMDVSELRLSYITGIEVFTSLDRLDCSYGTLRELDLSANTALTYLDCSHNDIAALDLSANTALTYLDCSNNNFAALDLSGNSSLTYVNCSRNVISSLALSPSAALSAIDCSSNSIDELDVSSYGGLKRLDVSGNDLTELDISSNTSLEELNCWGNMLESIDISKNTSLVRLNCSSNRISKLDIPVDSSLEELLCDGNYITSIDLSPYAGRIGFSYDGQNPLLYYKYGGETSVIDLSEYIADMSRVSDMFVNGGTLAEDGKTVLCSGGVVVTYKYSVGEKMYPMNVMISFLPSVTVAVEGGTIDGEEVGEAIIIYNDTVEVRPVVPEGKTFAGWSKDGGATVFTSSEVYSFAAREDVRLTAVFKDITEDTEKPYDTEKPDETEKPDGNDDIAEPEGLGGGAIAGIAIGCAAAVAAIGVAVYFIIKKRK